MHLRPLTPADLPRAAALSALIGWNQVEADWAAVLASGQAQGLDDGQPESLAATVATIGYGSGLAWIGMVLVRPDLRRQGHATRLMHWAMASLQSAGIASLALDATPAGRPVYAWLGFRDCGGFTRWLLPAPLPQEPDVAVRKLRAADWPAVLALDLASFGAPREALLRGFANRLPAAAWVAEAGGRISGAILGRDGLRSPGLGPLWAPDAASARALVAAARNALPGAAILDLGDHAPGLAGWLTAHGAAAQRPFTRMVLGADLPGNASDYLAAAGPEFG
jgi:ribosomal protein S18 acetylase RimI-like enzyme